MRKIGCKFLLGILSWIILFFNAWGQEITIEMSVENNHASVGDQIEMQVTINGVQRIAGGPTLSHMEGFEVTQGGASSQYQSINGDTSVSIVYSYTLYPQKVGTFSIGPAEIAIQGKSYKSAPIQMVVGKDEDSSSSSASAGQQQERLYYLETTVDTDNPYVNQQIVYTFRFFQRAELKGANLSLPDFNGFWKESLGKQHDFRTSVNGVEWNVTEIKFALFPTSAGQITIPEAGLELVVVEREQARGGRGRGRAAFGFQSFFDDDGFFGGATARLKKDHIKSKAVTLSVRPLPEAQKPANFSGLVGVFSLNANLSKQQLKVGESSTLTLELKGDGNMRDVQFPEMKNPDIKLYDDKPSLLQGGQERLTGVKSLKRAIVPTVAGTISIPSVSITYFNPGTGLYTELNSKSFELSVAPGENTSGSSGDSFSSTSPQSQGQTSNSTLSNKREVRLLAEDLLPLMNLEAIETHRPLTALEKMISFLIIILSPLIYFLCYFLQRRREKWENNSGAYLKTQAYKNFHRSVGKIKSGKLFYDELAYLFRDYLAKKLELEGTSITVIDVEPLLTPRGVPLELIEQIKIFLRECDMAQYGGGGESSKPEVLRHKVEAIVKQLEKKL